MFDGAALWTRIEELAAVNHPSVTAVQLNPLGSHDTPRALTICGSDLDSLRLATLLQMTLPGAPCIDYEMDRHGRQHGPGLPSRLPHRFRRDGSRGPTAGWLT